MAGSRYLLRTADGHYVGEYFSDTYGWAEGDEFTDAEGGLFRIVAIDPAKVLGVIHATWTVEPA